MRCSFVIPTFNCVTWLPHAVQSCFAQTHKDIEVVIVNDGSTDMTHQFLKSINDERIKVVNTENKGRSSARNLGNSLATGNVIFVLDADDFAAPNRVRLTLDKINKGAEFVYGSAEVMDALGRKDGVLNADTVSIQKMMETERFEIGIVHSSVAYTKYVAEHFPYSEDKKISDNGMDDWEQQVRILRSGIKMDFVPNAIVAYRNLQSAISMTRNVDKIVEIKKEILTPVAA